MSKLKLIAGPCVIEPEENVMLIAERIKGIAEGLGLDYYFKASFDNMVKLDDFEELLERVIKVYEAVH